MIIAIDGPAGAGKSTVAREVARVLGLVYLDTGAMYRAVTLTALERGIDPASGKACGELAARLELAFDGAGRITIDGRAGEPAVRGPQVNAQVSIVSAHPEVRKEIVAKQRALARRQGLVAEGRDTTTVVFPEADHKFFLTANEQERARRRALEVGLPEEQARIQRELERRDRLDSTRVHSPLSIAADARVVDTDGLSVSQVVERILESMGPRSATRGGAVLPAREDGRGAPLGTVQSSPAGTVLSSPAAPEGGADARARQRENAPLEVPEYPDLIAHSTLAYRAGRFVTRLAWALLGWPRHEGRANIPAEGGALICANHQSFLDIPLISHMTRRHVCFVARDSLAESRFLSWIMRRSGAVLVRRGAADRGALREMIAHLERGDLVCVFPEGTRTRDGSLGEFRAGALLAARQARVPILPVGIRGAFEAWPRSRALPRPARFAARVGAPIDARAGDALERTAASIAALIGDGRYESLPPAP